MILLLLALQGTSPETNAVMDRSRARAAEKRAAAAQAAAAPLTADPAKPAPQQPSVLPLPPAIATKFQACLDAANGDSEAGIRFANDWRIDGGIYYARQCLGYAYARAERWAPALVALEQGAEEAERAGDEAGRQASGRLWAQAGNAALAGGDAAKARADFDAALARGLPAGLEKGEVHLDRARALVVLKEPKLAREDIDAALDLAPQDPLAWLLSATLARRSEDLALAQKHIAQAVKLAPDDASVALEEGNIAILSSHEDMARAAWERAVRLAPDAEAGKAATGNLSRLAAK